MTNKSTLTVKDPFSSFLAKRSLYFRLSFRAHNFTLALCTVLKLMPKYSSLNALSGCIICFVFCELDTLCCQNGNFLMVNSGRFPQGKPAATELRYPNLFNYKVHAGPFRVSEIHRTLTWIIGSLTCAHGHSSECVCTRGLHGHTNSESAQHF